MSDLCLKRGQLEVDDVIIEEILPGARSDKPAVVEEQAVPLPPNRPLKISGDVDEGTTKASRRVEHDICSGPCVSDEAEIKRIALEEADNTLSTELSSMLGADGHADVAAMCGLAQDVPLDAVARRFSELLVDLLWSPMAGCVSRVIGLKEIDLRSKLMLFWRCAVALCIMPLSQLAMLTKRKRSFLNGLDALLPPEEAPAHEARLAHIRINLPLFSMVAQTPSDANRQARQQENSSVPQPASQDERTATTSETLDPSPLSQETVTTDSLPLPKCHEGDDARSVTAAKHTYDVGYKKWEKFDVDAALRETDESKVHRVDLAAAEAKAASSTLRSEDPLKALDSAIADLQSPHVGARVHIQNLSARPDLNGAEGVCGTWSEEKGRWQVRMSTGQVWVRPSNLVVSVPNHGGHELKSCEDEHDHAKADQERDGDAEKASSTGKKVDDKRVETLSQESGDTVTSSVPVRSTTPPDQSNGINYSKWEKFDVDAALEEADQRSGTDVRTPAAKIVEATAARNSPSKADATTSAKGPAVSRGFLAERMSRDTQSRQRQEKEAAAKAAAAQSAAWDEAERVREAASVQVAGVESKAADWKASVSASAELSSSDAEVGAADELEDVSDEEYVEEGLDLDALTGPQEEVTRIRSHWKREAAAAKRREANRTKKLKAREQEAVRQEREKGAVQEAETLIYRPCEYKPSNHKDAVSAKAISREYKKWTDFDADAAILELENEGKTEEGKAMRCETSKTSAMISHVDYTKDSEEYSLDQDIEKHVGGLKQMLAQKHKDAVSYKLEGNTLLREGRYKEACERYELGIDTMSLCQQASVIMSDSLASKGNRVVIDLQRNLAAAQLSLEDFKSCVATCDAVLDKETPDVKKGEDEKALYRRATALLRLGELKRARADIGVLAKLRGADDAVVARLRADADASAVAMTDAAENRLLAESQAGA